MADSLFHALRQAAWSGRHPGDSLYGLRPLPPELGLKLLILAADANRPGDATNAPGHDTGEVTPMRDKRTIRVSLNLDELRYIVGSLRDRIDGYEEQLDEAATDDEMQAWLTDSLAVIRPLERRLTKRGGLVDT